MALVRYSGPPELPPRQKIFPQTSVVACALLFHLHKIDPELECELRSGTVGPTGRAISSVFLHVGDDEWMNQPIDDLWGQLMTVLTRRERQGAVRHFAHSTYSRWQLRRNEKELEWQRYKWTLVVTLTFCVPIFLITYIMARDALLAIQQEALLAKASGEFETMTMTMASA